MPETTIWIVDDEAAICWSLQRAIEGKGMHAVIFSSAEEAIAALKQSDRKCDVILSDIRLPKADGFELTEMVSMYRSQVPVILMTAFGDLSTAIRAGQSRIAEYLIKPFDLEDAMKAIERAVKGGAGRILPQGDFSLSISETLLLGRSPQIQRVYRDISFAARSNSPVLISGPEGSPLAAVAAAIHRYSDRATSAFLHVIPSTISLPMLEHLLIGSVEAIDGASTPQTGLFALAQSGSLVIEEIGDLPKAVQLQLLQVLEYGTYLPLGAAESFPCNARIMVTSSRQLKELVRMEEVDERLYDRLRIRQIEIPPLRERPTDIIPIAHAILARMSESSAFTTEAEAWLESMPWIGDVRELRNTVEFALARSPQGLVDVEDLIRAASANQKRRVRNWESEEAAPIVQAIHGWLQEHLSQSASDSAEKIEFGMLYEDFLAFVEPPMLEELLKRMQYNRAATASKLGMHRSTLRQKMRRYGLD